MNPADQTEAFEIIQAFYNEIRTFRTVIIPQTNLLLQTIENQHQTIEAHDTTIRSLNDEVRSLNTIVQRFEERLIGDCVDGVQKNFDHFHISKGQKRVKDHKYIFLNFFLL